MEGIISTAEFQMSLLLFLALAGYLLASRINQSVVIGEIFFGILVGPGVFGLITYTGFVEGIAHLGAVILLFVIGLEFKLKDLISLKYGLIALFGVVLPWIGGYYLAILFGFKFKVAVIVGAALTATSVAITANILREMGKLQTDIARTIIGAAIIDDIFGLLALSFSTNLASGDFSSTLVIGLLLKVTGFLIVALLTGFILIRRAIIKIDNSRLAYKFPEIAFMFAMMVAFFYAMVAEFIGLSAFIGAFIAGISFGGIELGHSKNFREGADYLQIIFVSVFFISLGILVDFRALNVTILFFLLALTIIAILTKVIGCGLTARLQGMNLKNSLAVGFGMSPRGEAAMIFALIGLSKGLIGQPIYVSIVLMSLLTTIITPIIFRSWFYKEETPVRFKF